MLVIFNGPPGTGKDECCLFMEQSNGFEHKTFKKALFVETCKFFNVSFEWFMNGYDDRSIKEAPSSRLNGMSRREAMIHVSEEIVKPMYGKDFFGSEVSKSLEMNVDYCFSDGGFKEELMPIIDKFGVENICLIQLTREGCDFSSDSRRYLNGNLIEEFIIGKETPIKKSHILPKKFAVNTYRIHNNGTMKELYGQIEKICKTIKY
jgi:hypothetical protein